MMYGPISSFISFAQDSNVCVAPGAIHTHLIWWWNVIRPGQWLIALRFDLRGSDWINDGLTGVHWSGRKEPQLCRRTNVIIWGYDLSKLLGLHYTRDFILVSSHRIKPVFDCGLWSGTQIYSLFCDVMWGSRFDTWGNGKKPRKLPFL